MDIPTILPMIGPAIHALLGLGFGTAEVDVGTKLLVIRVTIDVIVELLVDVIVELLVDMLADVTEVRVVGGLFGRVWYIVRGGPVNPS